MYRPVCRIFLASIACLLAAETGAQELSPPLRKSEVEELITGKAIHYLRKRDGATIGWNFRSGDDVFYTNSTTTRNIPLAGSYRVTDGGAVCFKWNRDKYLIVEDGCVRFRREGNTLHVVSFKDPDNIVGDVVRE